MLLASNPASSLKHILPRFGPHDSNWSGYGPIDRHGVLRTVTDEQRLPGAFGQIGADRLGDMIDRDRQVGAQNGPRLFARQNRIAEFGPGNRTFVSQFLK